MKLVRILILVLACAVGSGAIAQTPRPAAPAASPHTPAHLAAADRVIDAMALAQVFGHALERSVAQMRANDPSSADLLSEASAPLLKPQFVTGELRDFVADQLDLASCTAIADFLQGPVGSKHIAAQIEELRTGKPVAVTLDEREQAAEQAFGQSKAGDDFVRFAAALGPRFDALTAKANAQLAANVRALLDKRVMAPAQKP
mgnify:FL=1